jgi:hypothetical protein
MTCFDLAPDGDSEIINEFVVFGLIDYTIDGDVLCIERMTNPVSRMHIQLFGDGYNENLILTISLTGDCENPCDLQAIIVCNET